MDLRHHLEIIRFKTVDLLPLEELEAKLRRGRPLVVKYGADPSRPDLHLGHYVNLRKLKDLQDLGHRIVFIVGDFTATIGDPSGRDTTRPRLSEEEVRENARTYFEQVSRVLDPHKTEVQFNASWLSKLCARDIVHLASAYTVARMLERDDFEKRYRSNTPIFIHEFLYPLFQGYDSYHIQADMEVGGTDQKFNFLVAREVQKHYGQEPQVILTLPLLVGTDGVRKMSKSYGNYIAFNDPPAEMYGKIMSIPDAVVPEYYSLVLYYDDRQLEEVRRQMTENPRDTKARLAYEIVKLFYSEAAARAAEEEFNRVFRARQAPSAMPEVRVPPEGKNIVDLIYDAGLVASKSEARRLIKQRAVRLNGEVIEDPTLVLRIQEESVLKVGKRKFLKLVPAREP